MTLKVLCARSMTAAVNAQARDFTRATGQELDITFGTVGALQAKLAAGESADVLVLGAPAIAKMEQAGEVLAGSRRDIAGTSIGVAVREGAAVPDVSTADAFKQALLVARAVAFSDPAVGGLGRGPPRPTVGTHGRGRRDRAQGHATEDRRRGGRAGGGRPGRDRADARCGDRADQGCARDRQ